MGKVRGTFEEFTGFVTTAERPSGCSAGATIALGSISTGVRMRDDDLRSANFFDIDRHPDMIFKSFEHRDTGPVFGPPCTGSQLSWVICPCTPAAPEA